MEHTAAKKIQTIGSLQVVPFAHPQGCRGYILVDQSSKEALVLDVHLDLVHEMVQRIKDEGWKLCYVVDTHTHADHPSGAAAVASYFDCTRMTHEKAIHVGVTAHPKDGEQINIGESAITVRYTPGHTPDSMSLVIDGAIFSGDSLLIGGVARTDFIGGDAGELFDSIHALLADLPEATIVFPAHDYQDRISSTLGQEKTTNPWVQISGRETFVEKLTANPPPKPANMDDLLRLNRQGVNIPASISADEASHLVTTGGAGSVIDVRTGAEFDSEHIPGSRLISLDQIKVRADEVRATPAPRLLFCRNGTRATTAQKTLEKLHVAGLTVVDGGLGAYVAAGGNTVKGKSRMSLERQVRIAAGSLVLTGLILGYFVSQWFFILSAFVGTGLVFAGITDTCGMGIMLGKMPWNKSNVSEGTPSVGGSCAANLPGACSASAPPAENKDD
jgi:glyoxylase-like metal-dependent hydrolase (beta-lactamase superfamily II)/rhodanese-related sulfurtransferase